MVTDFIPALRFHPLTKWYDLLVRYTTAESHFRPQMIRLLSERHHNKILDVGCGTGTLACMAAIALPNATVLGLDADAAALQIARAKVLDSDANVVFQLADAKAMPLADASFDALISSLFFHHLIDRDKLRVLEEMRRVLTPGGEIVIADWGKPSSRVNRMGFALVRWLDGANVTRVHASGEFPAVIGQAGFEDLKDVGRYRALLGTLQIWRAYKPATP